MTSKKQIEEFLQKKNIAVVGVSGSQKKFGYIIYSELKLKGYNVYPVNPNVNNINGDKCYPSLMAIKNEVEAAVLVIPPSASKEVVKDAHSIGIKKIWMQQGAESDSAISYCLLNDIDVIHNECILMFTDSAGFIHRAHKWVWGVLGKLPQ